MKTTIPQLSQILQQLLIEDANRIGRESGFIQRQRRFSGASFAQSLIFGWQANPEASLEELCQSAAVCGVRISPQGLQERLNSASANEFLRRLLEQGVSYLVQSEGKRNDLLAPFTGVYIQDSSLIELPASLSQVWPGNQAEQATLKLQAVLDYQKGCFDLTLASGRAHDCPLQTVDLPAGSLRLADLGYFKVKVFEQLNRQNVWWISRLPARAGIWQRERVIHLATWLKAQRGTQIDQQVEVTAQRLPCRLLALPVPDEVARERRRRVREAAAKRKNSRLRPDTLALCDWTILITNLPAEFYPPVKILAFQRLRWQIELLFKLWKSDLSLDQWRSHKPYQILTEVYAKLLLALIQHWFLLLGCWHLPRRSLVKAAQTLRKHAFHVLSALSSLARLSQVLQLVLPSLARCSVQRRKAHPATFQLLERAFP